MDNINNNDNTIDLKKLFSIMREQKKVIIPIIVICTVIAIIVAFVLPKSYQSNTLVRIKSSGGSNLSGYAAMAAGFGIDIGGASSASPENYIELMKSREVLEPIMEQVDMPEDDREKLTTENFIKKYLEITNTKKTDLINITAYGKTPEEAQMISQSVADNFLTLMTKLNKEGNSSTINFLNDRMAIAKEEMETAENKLQAYQQEKGIYSPDDQAKALIDRLSAYDTNIAQLEAQEQANSAKLQDVTGQLEQQNSSLLEYNISDNDAIMNLRTAIVNKQVELVGLEQRYTEEHPDVIQAKQELAELKRSLDREIQSAVNSKSATLTPVQGNLLMEKVQTETAKAVTSASLDALKSKQQEAEGNISTLSADSVEYMRLLRDQTITSEVYTNLVKAYENTRIQEAQESMDIQIIDAANLPREDMPAKPNKKIIAAIGFVLGIMISFGYTLYVYNKRYGL
ncbi:Tyrosine-protein kinase etk [Megamonas hypermegale]|uniref:Tyrosine-protein kinase etk n=1 Tax=Megamonas hypermegale TaxID=158847 RepID=A0A378NW56_9FIRM|nr:Wzz/FepE/Etk N-terminal domain-containing protein [Megamonas hypermegale]STY72105.1 Tyrosine-protein kinase etk [Megamonas hypermegale]